MKAIVVLMLAAVAAAKTRWFQLDNYNFEVPESCFVLASLE
jgi:hypothetical protein